MTVPLCKCGCGQQTTIASRTDPRRGHVKGEPIPIRLGHKRKSARRWDKADRGHDTPCWIWNQSKNRAGYGYAHCHGSNRTMSAHRFIYEEFVGAIPEGLVLDHLCRVPSCVNPEHLEPVTQKENVRRGLRGMLAPVAEGLS